MRKQTLGIMLRSYRKAARLSVKEVCQIFEIRYHVKITPNSIYAWESGRNDLTVQNLMMLSEIYNVINPFANIKELDVNPVPPIICNPEERELVLSYRTKKHFNSAVRKLYDITL